MKSKSVSVMTGDWTPIISKKLRIFLVLVPFEILSHYVRVGSPLWLNKDLQCILDKVFREKNMV